jgi:O-antigen ligase
MVNTTERLTVARMGAWALIVLGVVYLTVAGGGGFFGLYLIEFRVASVAMLLVALGVWLAIAGKHPLWRPRSKLTPAVIVSLAAGAIALLGSAEPRLGADFLAYGVLLAGAYWLLARLFAHPFFGPRLGVLAVLLGFGLSAMYIGVVVYRWIQFWSDVGRVVTPPLRPGFEGLAYGNPGTIATVVILLWLASAAHLGISTSQRRWIVAALGLMVAIVVFLTGSRGAWAGLAVAVIIVGSLWLTSKVHRLETMALLRSRTVRLGAIAAVLAIAAALAVFFPVLAGRLGEPAADTRSAFALASLRMFVSHPLTGVGPGMWVVDRIRFTDPNEADYYIPHAHNIVLQTLAELGVVGAVAGALVLGILGRLLLRGVSSPDALTSRLGWAALFGGVYLLGHQMFDFYANMPAIAFCYALTVARLDTRVSEDRGPVRPVVPYPIVAAALALAFALSGAWLAHSEEAASHHEAAVAAANAGDWTGARVSAETAVARDPAMPPYLFVLGLAEAHAGEHAAALEHIAASARIDGYPVAWLDVARLALDLGRADDARRAVEEAMRLGYQQPEVAVGASTLYMELGDRDGSAASLAAALLAAPGLASDPLWSEPAVRDIFESARTMALAQASPGIGYKIALEGGLAESARAIVAQLPDDRRLVPSLVVSAWVGDQTAFDRLHGLAMADPLDVETVSLCRRVAARSHDPDWPGGAPWACDGAGAPAALLIVRFGPPPTSRVFLPGPDFAWHFQYVYRRFAPWDELVPGLPHLTPVFV